MAKKAAKAAKVEATQGVPDEGKAVDAAAAPKCQETHLAESFMSGKVAGGFETAKA
ncbi:MAG TPA: hypothetical protein PKM88_07535 [bacterium]|nr:hypothetical protein [bacterium]